MIITRTNFVGLSFLLILPIMDQSIYQSSIDLSNVGQQYSPSNPSIQFLTSISVLKLIDCAFACNNNPMCQVFDYSAINRQECRLFEGDLHLMGHLLPSSNIDSQVGSVQLQSSFFTQYEQECSLECQESRYLICNTASKCDCIDHHYWNPTSQICLPKINVIGGTCQIDLPMCREDLNYSCSTATNQCQLPERFPLTTSTTQSWASTEFLEYQYE